VAHQLMVMVRLLQSTVKKKKIAQLFVSVQLCYLCTIFLAYSARVKAMYMYITQRSMFLVTTNFIMQNTKSNHDN
jgi:hypothetical protein